MAPHGRKLHGAAWHHDGGGPGRHRPAWAHRWVVVGVIGHPPFLRRAVCLPILARLWVPGDPDHTPLQLARELLDLVVAHVGDRPSTWSATPPPSARPYGACPPR